MVAADDDGAGAFRGASFTGADFTGANFRDCDLRQVKITDSWLVDVSLSGLVGNLVVNDVDVTAFVEGTERVILEMLDDPRTRKDRTARSINCRGRHNVPERPPIAEVWERQIGEISIQSPCKGEATRQATRQIRDSSCPKG